VNENAFSPLTFSPLVFNQGTPPVDVENGSVTVGASHALPQPNQLIFGGVPVGESVTRAFLLRNTGTALLIVDSITVPHCFISDFVGPAAVAPSEWHRVEVIFTPDSVRTYQDTLTIFSNASEGPVPVRLNGQGTPPSAADEKPSVRPLRFALAQNYPNPFNPVTEISYDVPEAGHVSLRVFDLTGREVAVLANGIAAAGSYRATFGGDGLPSGVYLARLQCRDQTGVRKMILMR